MMGLVGLYEFFGVFKFGFLGYYVCGVIVFVFWMVGRGCIGFFVVYDGFVYCGVRLYVFSVYFFVFFVF